MIVRVQMIVILNAVVLVSVGTVLLYLRTRTKPALIMAVAVLLGLTGQAVGYFSPHETIVEPPEIGGPEPGSPPRLIRGAGTRDAWETPAFLLAMSGVVLWVGGFLAHSFSAARKNR